MLTALYNSPPSVNPIPALQPAAWFRGGYGVTGTLTASNWADQSGNGRDLAQGTAGNMPLYLPFAGSPYVYLPAVASNTVTTPNKTVTGSQTITFSIALNDYTPGADVTLFSKTSGNDGFSVLWLTTDKLRFIVGDGASLTNCDASIASGLTDGTQHTITITWTDGVGASLAIDGVAWGSAIVAAKTLTNAAVAFALGSSTSIGKVYGVTLGSLINFSPSTFAETSTNGATAVASTGETWTLNSTGAKPAQIVKSASLLFDGTDDYLATGAFARNVPSTTYIVFKQISWTSGDTVFDGLTVNTLRLRQLTGSPILEVYLGQTTDGPAIGAYGIITALKNGSSSVLQLNNATADTTTNSDAANASGIVLGGQGTDFAANSNIQVKELIAFSAAHTAAQRASVINWLNSVHHVY